MDLRTFVKVYRLFSIHECDNALKGNVDALWNRHEWYGYQNQASTMAHVEDDPDTTYFGESFTGEILSKLVPITKQYFQDTGLDERPLVSTLSIPKLNRYQTGRRIQKHVDHIASLFDGTEKGIPILSYVLLMNNRFEGGDLKFTFADNSSYTPSLEVGEVVVWPSVFMYNHEVTPVTKGERYSVVVWGW